LGGTIEISATLFNAGERAGEEVAQLYIRDLVGNVTRPIRELKGFRRVTLEAGESTRIGFTLHTDQLAFYNRRMVLVTEPGMFYAWIGGDSNAGLRTEFEVIESHQEWG